ncbi:hypothetical protein KKA14_12595 [bacterium]|nr:hypothetical protein [bacterium]
MATSNPMITQHLLTEGSVLYSTPLGNILIGCPPEILKVMMNKHAPMPDTIVIPGTLHKFNSSQVCLEFPFYHFLFIQQGIARGKKFKILAKKTICEKLSELLRITLLGPSLDEILKVESRLKIPKKLDKNKIKQILAETECLAPKDKNGHSYRLDEMVEFVPFEIGDKKTIYNSYKKYPEVTIKRKDEDEFILNCDRELKCKLNVTKPQAPVYKIKGEKISESESTSKSIFSVRCLGSSEGFDPTKPANGFLLHFNGKWILWDCPAFLHEHFSEIGLSLEDIDGIFVSHVHEDHLDIMESIGTKKKLTIFTSPEIYHCMILKLMAIMDCDYDSALTYYDFHPVYVNKPFELFNATFEVFYSSHAIPALGLRLSVLHKKKESTLFFSGDNLSKRMITKLSEMGVYSDERIKEIESTYKIDSGFDISFVDAGGGAIHGDPEDYAECTGKIIYMHTGKTVSNIPQKHGLLKPGQRFIIHK